MLPLFAGHAQREFCRAISRILLTFFCWQPGHRTAGTAVAAISTQARMRELLLPVLLLPLLAPILGGEHGGDRWMMSPDPFMQWKGIGFLAVFDVVFLTALWLFGEYLLEE